MHNSKLYTVLIFLLAASCCVQHSNAEPPASVSKSSAAPKSYLSGEYFWGKWYMGATLKLFSNGKFKESTYSDAINPQTGAAGSNIYGYYGVKDGHLILSPKYSTPGQGAKPKYANKRTKWSGSAMRLLPVRWGSRLYLLYRNEQELDFCNAINLGDEPRPAGQRRDGSSFFLRVDDEKKAVTGLPQIPQQWSSYLLPTPVVGKVISVGKGSTAIVNVGKTDKIKVGMIFTDNKLGSEENTFKVIALQNHQATIKNEITWRANIKVGEEVSTRRNSK